MSVAFQDEEKKQQEVVPGGGVSFLNFYLKDKMAHSLKLLVLVHLAYPKKKRHSPIQFIFHLDDSALVSYAIYL